MGKLKRLGPDPLTVKTINEVLSQNRRILEMNARLLQAFSTPPYVVSSDVNFDFMALRPGEIRRSS